MSSAKAAALSKRIDELPVLPMVVARLLSLDKHAADYFDQVIELVELEPTYAARLIGAANTVENRGSKAITKLQDAIVRLGARKVAGLVVSMSVVRVFTPTNAWEGSLWRHAIEVAIGARYLAMLTQDRTLDPEQAYLSGLLHDIGRFLIFDAAPAELQEVDEAAWETPLAMVKAERHILGIDHAELGGRACERWSLPEPIVAVVRAHHSKKALAELGPEVRKTGELVYVADQALFGSLQHGTVPLSELSSEDAMARLKRTVPAWFPGMTPAMIEKLRAVETEAAAVTATLGLPPPSSAR